MKYKMLPQALYVRNRKKLVAKMEAGALAIFHSNDLMPTNADGHMAFRQNNDLLYLSGVDQEESILVVFPDAQNEAHREILFLKETNEKIAIWEGAKLDKQQAFDVSGVSTVMWLDSYDSVMRGLLAEAKMVYLNTNEHTRAHVEVETRTARKNHELRAAYPMHRYERIAPMMHQLRAVKEKEEIEQMRHACQITKIGLERVLKFVKPGVKEFEIEAEFAHEFLRRGSRGFAYTPIVASGGSACVLHYIDNDKACNAGEVILMDVGAEYGNYAADMTRCIPVDGRFTARQKEVYNAVLRVKNDAANLLRPGTMLSEYHKEVGKLMESELLGLGLIDRHDIEKQNPNWPAYKKYFMHGTSHFIGLDVHDVGLWTEPIAEGHVFTVEPGIYIQEEGLGIRLENDIVIQADGFDDLMGDIPIEADHIETLMNS